MLGTARSDLTSSCGLSLFGCAFLGMPYDQKFSETLIALLIKWVRSGLQALQACLFDGQLYVLSPPLEIVS